MYLCTYICMQISVQVIYTWLSMEKKNTEYLFYMGQGMYSGWGVGVAGGEEEEAAKQEKDYNIKSTVLPWQSNG